MTESPTEDPDKIMTLAEVAKRLNIAPGTLRYWRHMKNGEGPESFKIGSKTMYLTSKVEQYIAEQAKATSSKAS